MSKTFHTINLDYIKRITGASYVGFERYKDEYHLKFTKNKVTTTYKLTGSPSDITQDGYKKLLDLIIYGKDGENIISKLGTNEGL